MRCAVLCSAVLCCAVLCCAVLCCAVLCCAVLFINSCYVSMTCELRPDHSGKAVSYLPQYDSIGLVPVTNVSRELCLAHTIYLNTLLLLPSEIHTVNY